MTTQNITIPSKQVVREQKIPFRTTMKKPNYETVKAMAEVEYMIEHPKTIEKRYSDADSMLEDLL